MTLTLELNQAQETFLRRRAAEAGQEPAAYILNAAGIAPDIDAEAQNADAGDTGSAYDLFHDLIGSFASGRTDLSENTGVAYAAGIAGKRQKEHS